MTTKIIDELRVDEWKALHEFDKKITVIFAFVLFILSLVGRSAEELLIVVVFAVLPAFIIFEGLRIKKPVLCMTQAMMLSLLFMLPLIIAYFDRFDFFRVIVFTLSLTGIMGLLALTTTKVAGSYELGELPALDKNITVNLALVLIILGLCVGSEVIALEFLPVVVFAALPAFIILEGLRIKKPFLCMAQAVMLSLLFMFPFVIVYFDYFHFSGFFNVSLFTLSLAGTMGLLALTTTKVAGSYELEELPALDKKITVIFALVLIISGLCVGSDGNALLFLPVVFFAVLPAFSIVEGLRLKKPFLCMAQAVLLSLLFMLPFLIVYFDGFDGSDFSDLFIVIVSTLSLAGTVGLLALTTTKVAGSYELGELPTLDKKITVIFALVLIILGFILGSERDEELLLMVFFAALPVFIIFEGLRIKKPFLCMAQAVMLSLLFMLPFVIVYFDYYDFDFLRIFSVIVFTLSLAGTMGLLALTSTKVAGSYEIGELRTLDKKITVIFALVLIILGFIISDLYAESDGNALVFLTVVFFAALPAFIIFEGLRLKKPFLCSAQAVLLSLLFMLPFVIVHSTGFDFSDFSDFFSVIVFTLSMAGIMGLLALTSTKVAGSYELGELRTLDKNITVNFALVLIISGLCVGSEVITEEFLLVVFFAALPAFIIFEGLRLKEPFLCTAQAVLLSLVFMFPYIIVYSIFSDFDFYDCYDFFSEILVTLSLAGAMGLIAFISTKVAGRYELKKSKYEQKLSGPKAKLEQWEREGYAVSEFRERWFK